MLPWDSWGLMDRSAGLGQGAADRLVDEVAAVTAAQDWAAARRLYMADDRLRVPDEMHPLHWSAA
jgi:hypothetical protein